MYLTPSTLYLPLGRASKTLTHNLTLNLTLICPPHLTVNVTPQFETPISPLIYFFFQVLMYLTPYILYLPLWRASGWHLTNIIQTFCFILFRGFIFQYIVSLWLVQSIWWLQQLLVSWLVKATSAVKPWFNKDLYFQIHYTFLLASSFLHKSFFNQ